MAATRAPMDTEAIVLRSTMRANTVIFGVILGLAGGILLFALALAARERVVPYSGFIVKLVGVFLPFYSASMSGALAGLVGGFAVGGAIGAGSYWLNGRRVLDRLDALVELEAGGAEFPTAVLRLHGPSVGVALAVISAIGVLVTTNFLVVQGSNPATAHARLFSELLPGYDVTPLGSMVGAAEMFIVVYMACQLFAWVYNTLVARRRAPTGVRT